MVRTKWEKCRKDVLETPKFLRKGTKVLVEPTAPYSREVEGKYGKRLMYIVNTKQHGLIYVSVLQLVAIVDAFKGKYDSAITVEL